MGKIALVAALILAAPAAAAPLSKVQLNCGMAKAPAGFGDQLAAAFIVMDRTKLGPLKDRLGKFVSQCVATKQVSRDQGEAYFSYLLARLPREALARQLTKSGIALAKVDLALGFSGGKAADGDAGELLDSAGFTESRLGAVNHQKLLTYADLSRRMFSYQAKLLA